MCTTQAVTVPIQPSTGCAIQGEDEREKKKKKKKKSNKKEKSAKLSNLASPACTRPPWTNPRSPPRFGPPPRSREAPERHREEAGGCRWPVCGRARLKNASIDVQGSAIHHRGHVCACAWMRAGRRESVCEGISSAFFEMSVP